MCDSIRQYLVWFRLEVDKVFGEGLVTIEQKGKRLPALLEIIHEMKPLTMQIQTMDKVYQACERGMFLFLQQSQFIFLSTKSNQIFLLLFIF